MSRSLRRRVLKNGSVRFDVAYRDPLTGQKKQRTFTDPDAAQALRAAIDRAQMVGVRWPLQPLLDATGLDPRAFARRHHINATTIDRAQDKGLTDQQADHWATRAGWHPMCIWGWDWIDTALTAIDADNPAEAVA